MEKKIFENWKTIEDIEKQVKEKTGDPEAGFNAKTFWLGSKEGRHLMIPCLYRNKRKVKGKEVFTKGYSDFYVYVKFCPFTGKPLYQDVQAVIDTKSSNEFERDCSIKLNEDNDMWEFKYKGELRARTKSKFYCEIEKKRLQKGLGK